MKSTQVVIEDWDGDGAIRIPDEVLQELGVDVGDTLYLIEEYVGTVRCFVLSKSPQIPDRVDELVSIWEASAPPPPSKINWFCNPLQLLYACSPRASSPGRCTGDETWFEAAPEAVFIICGMRT